MVLYLGIWNATLLAILMYGLWGAVFYVVLLQSDVYSGLKTKLEELSSRKQWRLIVWLKGLFSNHAVKLSPAWLVFIFVFESPLSGVPIISLMYPKEVWWKGMIWVFLGAMIEVGTWFVPVYGGGISIIKNFLSWVSLMIP